ncbi:MAG: hypothetical protein NVSMB47_22230 [Polyangiales bacterium]
MRALLVTVLGSIALLSVAPGCALKTDDAAKFREGIPQSSEVALAVPRSGGSGSTVGAKGLSAKGAPAPATDARYYRFTRDIADGVDWGTTEILGLVWLIVHQPPTTVDAHRAVWGPGNGDALDPVQYRFVATEVGTDEYDYVLSGRPKGSTSEGDFKALLTGHGFGEKSPSHRLGWFLLDNDAHNALDPARAKDDGTVRVDYDGRSFPVKIAVDAHSTADAKGWFKVALTHDKDGGGQVGIDALGDIEEVKGDGKLETVTLDSRWNATGAGRADAQMSGGDLSTTVTATECWSTSFSRVFYTDNVSHEPTVGVASACAFDAR